MGTSVSARGRSASRLWWWIGGAALAVAVIVMVVVWPSPKPAVNVPPPRARVYNAFTVCLLTGPQGIAGDTAPVWAGVSQAANTLNDQAQYLAAAVMPETVGSVTSFANTLVQEQCGLVVAIGPVEVATVESIAPANPKTRFMVVGGGAAAANVKPVADATKSSVAAAVQAEASDG